MHLIRVSAPAALPVSLAEVMAGSLEGEDEARIAGLIRAAVEQIDGPDGEIQRQLITATWEMRLDAFPGSWCGRPAFRWPSDFCPRKVEIEIPLPPLQSVTSIQYISGGSELTLDAAEYQVAGVDDRHKARIRPVTAWPSTDDVMEAVMIRYTAGYGDSWNDVPETLRHAITAMVQALYDGCESDLPEKLLRRYRVDLSLA